MFLYMVSKQSQYQKAGYHWITMAPESCNLSTGSSQTKFPTVMEEIRSYQFWKAVRCEFLITLLYVFIGCGTLTVWDDKPQNDVTVALAFGLSAATFVQCVGHISGAHINPAVSLAMLVTRNISVLRATFYIVAHLLGSVAGAGILYGVTPSGMHGNLGVTLIHNDVGLAQAFGVEFMTTFIVVFTVFANLEPRRTDLGSRSLAIGLSVIIGHLSGLKYTGASMNPARSLGPALVMNIWSDHWVYWIGPLLGGIIGGFTYEYTHDSSSHLQTLRRSFKRRPTSLKQSRSFQSNTSLASTEMTYTPNTEDLRI